MKAAPHLSKKSKNRYFKTTMNKKCRALEIIGVFKQGSDPKFFFKTGDPGKNWTCDPQFRKLMLYPAELRDQYRNLRKLTRPRVSEAIALFSGYWLEVKIIANTNNCEMLDPVYLAKLFFMLLLLKNKWPASIEASYMQANGTCFNVQICKRLWQCFVQKV